MDRFAQPSVPFQIGSTTVEPSRHRLIVDGSPVNVEPLVMRILVRLASDPGSVVTRHDLLAAAWPDGFAGDGSVSRAVWALRRALGDDAAKPRYIETIPRVGYRLIPDVHPIPDSHSNGQPDGVAERRNDGTSPRLTVTRNSEYASDRDTLVRSIRRLRFAAASLSVVVVGLLVALVFVLATPPDLQFEEVRIRDENGLVDTVVVRSSAPIEMATTFGP